MRLIQRDKMKVSWSVRKGAQGCAKVKVADQEVVRLSLEHRPFKPPQIDTEILTDIMT